MGAPDTQLESAIPAGDRLDSTLRALVSTGAGVAIRIIAALAAFDESRFMSWLRDWIATRRLPTTADADALGGLILERRWQRAVDYLVGVARQGRDDFRPTLRVRHDMIGIFTRWSLNLSPITCDDKWRVLEELATDLYPNGPDHNELWERVGGRESDLQSFGSGRSRWRDAIAQIRRGKGPTARPLLYEMANDFPFNDQVRYLAGDPDFGGGYWSSSRE